MVGDACIKSNDIYVAPTSTVVDAAIVNAIVARLAELLAGNPRAEFFISSNIDSGEEINKQYIEKYKNQIKFL